eukprot:scaffold1652_cov70-Phaeocystis_antarctica.AAC.1
MALLYGLELRGMNLRCPLTRRDRRRDRRCRHRCLSSMALLHGFELCRAAPAGRRGRGRSRKRFNGADAVQHAEGDQPLEQMGAVEAMEQRHAADASLTAAAI